MYKKLHNQTELLKRKTEILEKIPDITRDGYSKKKIPVGLDTIIIGSGIGGLSCGAILSKIGKKVLVLEQHYIAGGCTHTFEDKGYEFDTGVHYIGNIEKRKKVFDLLTEKPIEWDQMGKLENGYCYDEINIEGKMYYLRSGEYLFLKEIENTFPDELKNVKRYIQDVKKIASKDMFFLLKVIKWKWLSGFLNLIAGRQFRKYLHMTALEGVQQYTSNKELQAVLLGQFGDYGKLPSKESFFLHCSIVNHYLNGGWFPRGGSSMIAKQLIPTILHSGGRVLVRKKVKQILVNAKKQAYGVEMENGDKIFAKTIISACGIPNTWKRLVDKQFVPKSIKQNIDDLGVSCSFMYVFVGMKCTPETLQLRSSNIWHWPDKDYDKMMNEFDKYPLIAPMPMFIGFPCAKDSMWNTRYPNKSNAVILTMMKYEHVKQWEKEKQGKRGKDYEDFKQKMGNRILEEGLYHYYPEARKYVDYVEVASPLTFNHYINSLQGEAYGLENYPSRFKTIDWLRPETHIENLFLTGQDICTLGITGALMSGVITTSRICNYGTLLDLVSGRNIIQDLSNL